MKFVEQWIAHLVVLALDAADEIERLREENAQLLDRISRIDGTYAAMFSIVDALQQKDSE